MTGDAPPSPQTVHAGCVRWGPFGILIRGAAGAGKSTLARIILHEADCRGEYARLVSDDRTILSVSDGQLFASPHPLLQGKLEVRGLGLITVPFQPSARLHLLADVIDAKDGVRTALPGDLSECPLGVRLPLMKVVLDAGAISAIRFGLNCLYPGQGFDVDTRD
ncbi:MAG: HPr kinase/phosphatase C-terminal domain-containing protein [Methylobacteriaceae bacterium]|jgi:hypothetical protein|nr:HPr kinase/phosphatase C-terminal domain-containing protein [Methylobacteriaceae bacterium]